MHSYVALVMYGTFDKSFDMHWLVKQKTPGMYIMYVSISTIILYLASYQLMLFTVMQCLPHPYSTFTPCVPVPVPIPLLPQPL